MLVPLVSGGRHNQVLLSRTGYPTEYAVRDIMRFSGEAGVGPES